jgi:hypothetical protein
MPYSSTLKRSSGPSRIWIDLVSGKLDESEIDALEACLLADLPPAPPEQWVKWAIEAAGSSPAARLAS